MTIKNTTITLLAIATLSLSLSARDQIKMVGSSTVYPFASSVAEELGATTKYPTPVVESTGSGGGMKLFCSGNNLNTPDITNASRRMKVKEFKMCQKNGVIDITGTGTSSFTGNVKVKNALIDNATIPDIDSTTTTVASVAKATYTAAFFDYVIKKGTNVRAGIVYACHDGTNVEFAETSTTSLGDTSDVTLTVTLDSTNMMFKATTTSNDWSVKSLIRAI